MSTSLKNLMCLQSLLIFLAISCSTKKASQSFNQEFSVTEIGAETFVVTDRTFYDSNVLVARMKDDTVIIASSPYETQGGLELIKWIKEKWHPKRIIAINTHFHSDGTGSNDAFRKSGVEVWASDLTKKLHQKNAVASQQAEAKNFGQYPELKKRIESRAIVFAEHTFHANEGKEFKFGDEKVLLIYPGLAHSPDNLVVYLPKRKVLYGTCMIRPGDSLGYLGDASVESWANSVKNVSSLDANVVIPGHGKIGGHELIKRTIDLAIKEQNK